MPGHPSRAMMNDLLTTHQPIEEAFGVARSFSDMEVASSFFAGIRWRTGVENLCRGATDHAKHNCVEGQV